MGKNKARSLPRPGRTAPNRRPNWRIALFAAAFLLLFYTLVYSDILITVQHSLNLWDYLAEGRLSSFYAESYGAVETAGYSTGDWVFYDFPLYVIFAVWNLPLWLLRRFWGVAVLQNPLCVMWAKTLLLVFTGFALWVLARVCLALGLAREDAAWANFLTLSSALFLSAVVLLGQYDVIAISLMLLGLEGYLRGDTRRFLLFFALSAPMKFFTLLAFVPLLLLREKRLGHILLQLACSVSLLAVFRLLFRSEVRGDALFWFLFASEAPLSVGSVYLFVLGMAALVLICYCRAWEDTPAQKRWAVYVCLASYSVFFLSANSYPYWIVYLVPFISLVMVQNREIFRVNLLLDLVLSGGVLLAYLFKYFWCFNGSAASSMLLAGLLHGQKLTAVYSLPGVLAALLPGHEAMSQYFIGAGVSAFAAALGLLLIINCPAAGRLRKGLLHTARCGDEKVFLALRLAAGAAFCCVPIGCYLAAVL